MDIKSFQIHIPKSKDKPKTFFQDWLWWLMSKFEQYTHNHNASHHQVSFLTLKVCALLGDHRFRGRKTSHGRRTKSFI